MLPSSESSEGGKKQMKAAVRQRMEALNLQLESVSKCVLAELLTPWGHRSAQTCILGTILLQSNRVNA
jgi:hypothetical protein